MNNDSNLIFEAYSKHFATIWVMMDLQIATTWMQLQKELSTLMIRPFKKVFMLLSFLDNYLKIIRISLTL